MRNIFLCNLKSSDQSTNVIDQPAVHIGMKPSSFCEKVCKKHAISRWSVRARCAVAIARNKNAT